MLAEGKNLPTNSLCVVGRVAATKCRRDRWRSMDLQPAPSTIVKTYPPRGPMQQFRFAESTAFDCFRCGQAKKSKLITVYRQDWSRRLCNGCYGRLLSIYEIKAGTAPD